MNITSSDNVVHLHASRDVQPRLHDRLRQRIRHRSRAGALPVGRNSPQRVAHGLYAEQLSGTAFTAPRAREPAQLAVPHPPGGDAWHVRAVRAGAASTTTSTTRPGVARPAALEPAADARGADRFRRRPVHHGRQRRPAAQHGVGIHLYAANRAMEGRFFYDADGELLIVPQQGALAHRHRAGRARSRAAADRGDPARRALPRRAAGRRRRAATSARTSARCCGCPTWARSAPTAWPIRAIS